MKEKDTRWDLQQAEYLLEYDRRKIQDCVDVFRNLAAVFSQMDVREGFLANEQDEVLDSRMDREQCLQEEYARENRKNLASQMRQLASLMQDVAGTSVQMIRLGARQERQIVRALSQEGLSVSEVYLLRGKEGKLEISAMISSKREQTVTVRDIAGYFSVLLDLRIRPQKRNPYFIGKEPVNLYFEEEPAFGYMAGAASAVKEGERVSGDSYSFLEQDSSIAVILSDGTGAGEEACADSSRVVELTEQILDAGMSGSMAVQLMNSMLRAQAQEEHMSTLDLCHLNLQSGIAHFIKAGGVCSFIRRSEEVERVGESSLPLGLEKDGQLNEYTRKLEDGDMVIMLSDGIIQDWPGEDCFSDIQEQIGRIESKSPQDMANRLLRYVIGQCRGLIRDDMTVLTIGIWENDDGEERL